MDRKQLQGPAVAVIGGGVLTVIGCLMTWISASGGFVVYDRSGVNYDSDAVWMIVVAVLAALTAVGELMDLDVLPALIRSVVWLDGAIITGLGVWGLHQIRDQVDGANFTPGVSASVGPGVYVAIAGGVLVLLSGLKMAQVRKALKEEEPAREHVAV